MMSATDLPYLLGQNTTPKSSVFTFGGSGAGGGGWLGSSGSGNLDNIFDRWNGGMTKEEREEADDLCTAAQSLGNVYIWVLFAIGVPGNILTIITILTMQAISPATFFVALLAFFDGSALVVKLIYHQLARHEVYLGIAGCKFEFLATYTATTANWMLVLIAAERFVSVCYPLKKVYLFTKRRSYISATVMTLALLVFFATIFGIMRDVDRTGKRCGTLPDYITFWMDSWFYINAALFLFIPFLFISILTVCIVRGLCMSRRERRSLMMKGREGSKGATGSDSAAAINNQRLLAETERTERTITIMVILAAALFLLLSLPACVFYVAYYARDVAAAACNSSVVEAKWRLFKQIQHLVVDASHALNFFIYFFTAKRFRDHLFKVLTCKICRKVKYNPRYQNTYSTSLSSSNRVTQSVGPPSPTAVSP